MSTHRATALARLRDAAAMTLVVHAARAACAALLVAPLLFELAGALPGGALGAPFGSGELEALLEAGARDGRRLGFWALGCAAGYALLGPLLALAWQCALARKQPVLASLARAASGYLPALALGACALAGWVVTLAAAALLLQPALAAALPHSAALDAAWTGGTVAAVALCGLLIGTLHDLARAHLALGGTLAAALRSARAALELRLLFQHALLAVAVATITGAAELAGRAPIAAEAAAIGQHALALGATFGRAAWLAVAVNAAAAADRREPRRP